MRFTTALLLITIAVLASGCSREEEKPRPALERAQEEFEGAVAELETRFAEGKVEAEKALAAAKARWEELRPQAEKAVASLEERLDELSKDGKALERLPPETLDKVRQRIRTLREKLAEAKVAHEQGDTDLAVEKADDVERESAAVEDLLVERPDPPKP